MERIVLVPPDQMDDTMGMATSPILNSERPMNTTDSKFAKVIEEYRNNVDPTVNDRMAVLAIAESYSKYGPNYNRSITTSLNEFNRFDSMGCKSADKYAELFYQEIVLRLKSIL